MDTEFVARVGLALSSATRLHVWRLADGRRSLREIAEAVGIVPSTATHHVCILAEAGLIELRWMGRRHVPLRARDGLGAFVSALGRSS